MSKKLRIKHLRRSGKILASALELSKDIVQPGIPTLKIDSTIHSFIVAHGARPSFLGLDGYPFSTCISVNDQVVHATPSSAPIALGDIVTVDIGVSYKGHCTDAARTFVIGEPTEKQAKLIHTANRALDEGIEAAVAGNRVGDISYAIQRRVELNGFFSPLELGGHGIGFEPHEDPFISNTGMKGTGELLEAGMCLAIEPIVMGGSIEVYESDDYAYYSEDGSLSAHSEDTIIVLDLKPVILTRETFNGGIV